MNDQMDNTDRGYLCKNKYREEGSKKPDYKGMLNIGGKEMEIAGWVRKSKAGSTYLSLRVSEKTDRHEPEQKEPSATTSSPEQPNAGGDEEVPF